MAEAAAAWPHGYGLCHCGCGERTWVPQRGQPSRGWRAGVPVRYRRGHHAPANRRTREKEGYWSERAPQHPDARANGYVLEHVLVAERALGKPLPTGAVVHHINGVKDDNRSANLVVCQDQSYHMLLHQRLRALRACGNPAWRKCHLCGRWDAPENLYILRLGPRSHSRHRACHAASELRRRSAR